MKQDLIKLLEAGGNFEIPFLIFMGNLALAAFLSYFIGLFYTKYGRSASHRSDFSRNFVLLTMTTMLVISIVKASLALSLGLVGALSIVRFRAAIKEPEELTFLFLCIALGLGLGAGQTLITVAALGMVMVIVWLRSVLGRKPEQEPSNLFLTVSGTHHESSGLNVILPELKKHFQQVDMKRWEDRADGFSASFLVDCMDAGQLQKFRESIRKNLPDISIAATDAKVL